MADQAFRISNLHKTYTVGLFGKLKVLRGLSLDLRLGQSTCLFGANGAGKSTLIRILTGLIHADSGEVLAPDGRPFDRRHRYDLGYLPEVTKFPSGIQVRALVENVLKSSHFGDGDPPPSVDECLEVVGLGKMAGRFAEEMSKGQRQRLSWALASLHRPKFMILDEPWSGLDPVGQEFMSDQIGQAGRIAGRTVLFSTHEIERGLELADRVVVVKAGSVAWESSEPKNLTFRDIRQQMG